MSVHVIPRVCSCKISSKNVINECTKLGNVFHRTHHLTFSGFHKYAARQDKYTRTTLATNFMSNTLILRSITSRCRFFANKSVACYQKLATQGIHNLQDHATQKLNCQSPLETKISMKKKEHRCSSNKRPGVGSKGFKENIATIPNILTLSRMASAPVIGYLVLDGGFSWALGLFICAGITDVLDGVIARNMKNQTSVLGTVLDPLADKILVMALYITLTAVHLIPVPLTALIVSRDFALIAASFYIRYISLPPPKTLARYFDFTHATAELYPSTISKVNTVLQLSLVALSLAAPVFDFVNHPCLQALWFATAATTFASGLGYVLNTKSSVKILTNLQQK